MPELPEVEIVARRLEAAVAGAEVESALAPGMNVMKTFEPPLDSLAGREITAVRRVGKMPVVVQHGEIERLDAAEIVGVEHVLACHCRRRRGAEIGLEYL